MVFHQHKRHAAAKRIASRKMQHLVHAFSMYIKPLQKSSLSAEVGQGIDEHVQC